MPIEIYSKDHCPFCDMAVHKAQAMIQESRGQHTYKVFKLNVDFGREEMLSKFPEARTFPQIIVDGDKIGGWDNFKDVEAPVIL